MSKLNDTRIKAIKEKGKYYDGNGLYLQVLASGSKSWRIDYRFDGKYKTLTLGLYPTVTLAQARKELADIKIKLNQDVDPQAEKKAIIQTKKDEISSTFENVALEWFDMKKEEWRESHATKTIQLLQKNIFPFLANLPINKISAKNVWEVLKRIEERGARDTVIRAKGVCSQVFCYGVATSRCEHDVTAGLKGIFKKPRRKNFAAITDTKDIAKLLRDIDFALKDHKRVSLFTVLAIKLIMYTFVRSQEACKARWEEFDFEKGLWTIPEEHKKEKRGHIVPLPRQALELLEELRPYTERTGYLFPSDRSSTGHIAGESLSKALRENLGYKDKQTIHGFRAMASTILNEQSYNPDVIEKALAHKDRNEIRDIYNKAEYIEYRRKMLQDYADYLDKLKEEE